MEQLVSLMVSYFEHMVLRTRPDRVHRVGNISAYHHWSCEYETRLIQDYVIQFVRDLRQIGGFLRSLRFPSPIQLTTTTHDITEIL